MRRENAFNAVTSFKISLKVYNCVKVHYTTYIWPAI